MTAIGRGTIRQENRLAPEAQKSSWGFGPGISMLPRAFRLTVRMINGAPAVTSIPVSRVDVQNYEPFLVDGKPFGEVHWLRQGSSGAGLLLTGLWTHEPATFPYTFPADETFHLLEGKVCIKVDGLEPLNLVPGDIVSFRKGQVSTWTISERLKKFFVISG